MSKKKVLVAMSGGVDSAVSAYLLKKKGFDVTGVTMCLGINPIGSKKTLCCGPKEIQDAKAVCTYLSIPHYVFNFADILEKKVIKNFLEQYKSGNTPNPCVECNKYLKFGKLLDQAKALGFDFIATGHYAKIGKYKGQTCLKIPKDKIKDQTYFLYKIEKEKLESILFPLDIYTKDEVRKIAKKVNLPVAEKTESQDICFITGKNYKEFLKERGVKNISGNIIDTNGNVLGIHKGITNYTIGQHKGLGISTKSPLFIVEINAKNNTLVVAEKTEKKVSGLVADSINLFVKETDFPKTVFIKIRYRQAPIKTNVYLEYEKYNSKKHKILKFIFEKHTDFIATGQSCVIYYRNMVLGGGIIKKVIY
ncbi:MAG: tRNA 2-thiouridine(34) synthase MnmA [Elusimicrobiota bacterium]|jgi:tRNA-specific 2-thiouridylase|nr:tRNA 2-thiouridine(34) synthase MnmA [Elusimicrobiota bacterium]